MKKVFFFLWALLCLTFTVFSQDCDIVVRYADRVDLIPDILPITTTGPELRNLTWGTWHEKKVIIHPFLKVKIPDDLGCYSELTISGPNQTYTNVLPGDLLNFALDPGNNNLRISFLTCTESALVKNELKLHMKQNDTASNDYGENYSYSSPDVVHTVSLDQPYEPPCVGAYNWAANTCLEDYNNASSGSIKLYIKYGKGRNFLQKPIIFVEGLDLTNDVVIDPATNQIVRIGSNGWENVVQGLVESKPVLLENGTTDPELFRNYPKMLENLGESDINAFDIILIDFHDGADYIQKNGELVIKAIEWINETKQCGEENVVVGLSMGGQVARWALTTMEKRGINHDTRTYISYDSPQLGANIPLSIQGFIWLNANFGDEKTRAFIGKKWLDLNKPAAAQMLYTHFYKEWQSGKIGVEVTATKRHPIEPFDITPHHQINPGFDFSCLRESYLAEMNALGYPKLTYNIAIANGSGTAVPQTFSPGACILTSDNINFPEWLPDVLTIELYASPGNVNGEIMKVLVPNKSEKTVVFGKITRTDLFDHPPYDAMPGCTRNDVAAAIKPALEEEGVFEFPCVNDATCFMPTSSVIGYETNNYFGNLSNIYDADKNITPFDEAWLPSGGNEAHVDANFDNINFMEEQKDINLPDQPSELPMPFDGGDAYCFGRFYKKMPSCQINSGGKVFINREENSSYFNADIPFKKLPTRKNLFEVTLAHIGCDEDEVKVNINEGGELIIGSPSLRDQKRGIIHVVQGTFLQNRQGKLTLYDKSRIEIHEEGVMILSEGSESYLEDLSEIVIHAGGKLIIQNGSFIQLKGNSRIFVEKGGELVIEGDAEILLDSPMRPDMLATSIPKNAGSVLLISGRLNLPDGVIKVGGSGFVWFLDENNLSFPGSLFLEGHGKDHTAFRFDARMEWELDEFSMNNSKCMVNKPVKIMNAGEVSIQGSALYSPFIPSTGNLPTDLLITRNNENIVELQNVLSVVVHDSDFDDMPVHVDDFEVFLSVNSEFTTEYKSRNIQLKKGVKSNFSNCMFKTVKPFFIIPPINPIKKSGIDCSKVFETRISNSQINGFNISNSRYDIPDEESDLIGVRLEKSPYLYMTDNTEISHSAFGVFSPDAVNIVMNNSSIKDCKIGIQMTGASDLGMVKMLCSTLENNQVGINGIDILLAIDGIINSQTTKNGYVTANYYDNIQSHFSICYKNKNLPGFEIPARLNRWVDKNKYALSFCGGPAFMELIQTPENDGMCARVQFSSCEDQSPGFPLTQSGIDANLYTGLCNSATCKGEPIIENYWRGFSCFYNDNLWETSALFQPLAEEYFVDGNEVLPLSCRSMLKEANTFVSGFNFFRYDSTVSTILEVQPSCRKTGANDYETVLVLHIPEWAKPYNAINWYASEGGVIYEMSPDKLEIITNGTGKYLAAVNGLQCVYRGYYNFTETLQFPFTCPPACLTSAPVLHLNESNCTLYIQNSVLEDVLEQANASFILQKFLNGQWVNISGMTSFQVTEDGTYRYIVQMEGCDDMYSNYVVTNCSGQCQCFAETLVYNEENCRLSWSNFCEGFSVTLQRQNPDNSWVNLAQNVQTPFYIQIDGSYRLVFQKEGCFTSLSNSVITNCALPGLCSCEAPSLQYNAVLCSLNWLQPACAGYTTTLEKQSGGVWSMITNQSPYTIPTNANGNYRLVTRKAGCFPGHSNTVIVQCSCTSPEVVRLYDTGVLGTDLDLESFIVSTHLIPFSSNVCGSGIIEALFSKTEVSDNWNIIAEGSMLYIDWNYTGHLAKVYLTFPEEVSAGVTRLQFTSPCGDVYTVDLEYSCEAVCPGILVEFAGNTIASCENISLLASGGSSPYSFSIIGEGNMGTLINQQGSEIDLSGLLIAETINLQILVTDANGCTAVDQINYVRCGIGCQGSECLIDPVSCGEVIQSTLSGYNENAIVNFVVEENTDVVNVLLNPFSQPQEYEISKNGDAVVYHSSIAWAPGIMLCEGYNYFPLPDNTNIPTDAGMLIKSSNYAKSSIPVVEGDILTVRISNPNQCSSSSWQLKFECEEGELMPLLNTNETNLAESEDSDDAVSVNSFNNYNLKFLVLSNIGVEYPTLVYRSDKEMQGEIYVSNNLGQVLFRKPVLLNQKEIYDPLGMYRELPSGIYTVSLRVKGQIISRRFIKI